MTEFFEGRKEIDKVHLKLEKGKVDVLCRVWEQWDKINSAVARCGNKASFTFKRSIGLSEKNSILVEKQLGASLGYKGIAEIKAGVAKKLQKEIRWEVSIERELNYSFEAPRYGKRIESYYQLTRDFHIKCIDDRLFKQGFDGVIEEQCDSFDCQTKEFPTDPKCGKREKPPTEDFSSDYEGIFQLDLGKISCKTGFYRSENIIQLDLGNNIAPITFPESGEYYVTIPTDFLPKSLTFLGGIKDNQLSFIANVNLVRKIIKFTENQHLNQDLFRETITISKILPKVPHRPPISGNWYEYEFRRSIDEPEIFWGEVAEDCHWYKKWDKVLDDSEKPFYRWFSGGEMNTCYNALDYHIENDRGEQNALIYDSPVTDTIKKYTYNQLRDEVAAFAGALAAQGVAKGDRVVIYMPMIPEVVIAMLACVRLGAVHSVVFGGFAARELASRINDTRPKIVVSASCGIEVTRVIAYKPILDEAISISEFKPDRCIIKQRPMEVANMQEGRDLDWDAEMAQAQPHDCVPVAATDPLYILYTSGTTGGPKGIVRDNGGHLVALKWTMSNIYNVDIADVFWAASDVGWVIGHSYSVYGPLFKGCTTIIFEGKPVGTPDAGALWRVISDHNVKVLLTAPTAFRAIRREDPEAELKKKYDLSEFKALFLAGERTDPDTLKWAENILNVPVIDHWWQTETGWAIAANCLGLHHHAIKEGSPTKAAPGWNLEVVDENNKIVNPGEIGALVVKLPLPPGTLSTLWNNDQGFLKAYLEEFPGYFKTGDAGFLDEDGYVFVMSRTDDFINVAGHRLSTGAMEEVLADHPDVAECAVLGVDDKLKGQVPIGFLVLKAGVTRDPDEIIKETIQMVRDRIGSVASFKAATVVKRLPKTRSGRILRGAIQRIAENKSYKIPATIDEPVILDEMVEAFERMGYTRTKK